jgi:ATP-binding cassette subfamily E protein 1
MPKKVAAIDYAICTPGQCDHGICAAALACEYGNLIQPVPFAEPEVNPAKWCHGCASCVAACPMKAIEMLDR